jgi:type IV pilus assembly protein PilC
MTDINTPPPQQEPAVEENFDEIILDIKEDAIATKKDDARKGILYGITHAFNLANDWVIEQSPVKLQEKLLFFQLLGAIVQSGISIPEALRMLEAQTANQKMKRVISDIHNAIEGGASLAGAMRQNDDIFDRATCSIVEAGEKSGKLNEVLKELVSQYERLSSIQKKVKSVMTYPIIVIVVMALLAVVVVVFVVPKLIELFGDIESLPLPTRILVALSDLVLKQWPILIGGIIAFITAFTLWKKSRVGKLQWAQLMLMFPIVGGILKGMILSRVTRIFGFLIASGVPIVDGLKITASISGNPIYEEKLLLTAEDLSKGIPIAENLADSEHLFPQMLISMISIGEKTASLEGIMTKIADFYEDELERKIGTIAKLMEPVILAFIAIGAVFMILAIYLPILQMNDQMIK